MKLKSYLKGIGIGFVLASVILILAGNSNKPMSDADVIKRAKELGMIESTTIGKPYVNDGSEQISDTADNKQEISEDVSLKETANTDNGSDTVNNTDNISDTADSNTNDDSKSADISTNVLSSDTTDKSTVTDSDKTDAAESNDANNKDTSNSDTNNTDKTNNDNKTSYSDVKVIVTISSGESSESVSRSIVEAGLADDEIEFNKYLCENGYDKRLRVGTYEIPLDADFETVSKYLCGMINEDN
ncbi:MAG: hypothetical protein J5840_05080 [Lachnospiraceae bacterium]|nr:hypothetical protein [Lachnospiraceae bacterium]